MIQAKCIQRFRDKNNVIIGYRLIDINGQTKDVKPENLKRAIANNQIQVANLTLTSDWRLVDTSEKRFKSKKTLCKEPIVNNYTPTKLEEQNIKDHIAKAKLAGLTSKEIETYCYNYITRKLKEDISKINSLTNNKFCVFMWIKPLSNIGSYLGNNEYTVGESYKDKAKCKRIRYIGIDNKEHYANPYIPGCIICKESALDLQMICSLDSTIGYTFQAYTYKHNIDVSDDNYYDECTSMEYECGSKDIQEYDYKFVNLHFFDESNYTYYIMFPHDEYCCEEEGYGEEHGSAVYIMYLADIYK